jgi:NAD(P)-dependent dehydrogenase (short-subunit alcohol dehydrogenase family)
MSYGCDGVIGGDSGIGRSVAVLFAREGADVAINYLDKVTAPLQLIHAADVRWCEPLLI